jgi:ubiquinone/menaquinone biosynthesis C-methylase UbiE
MSNEQYTKMQKDYYDNVTTPWDQGGRLEHTERWREHAKWKEFDNLWRDLPVDTKNCIALDFGCGSGRNLVYYHEKFKRIDGTDLTEQCIENAKQALVECKMWTKDTKLYQGNGIDLSNIPSDMYSVVFSTIVLQHICVHSIRYSYLSEFFRVLKPGGWISIQMGFGQIPPQFHPHKYFENANNAKQTNGGDDVLVLDANDIKIDLDKIGFKNYSYTITEGSWIGHPQAIWFRAQKDTRND